MYLIIEYSQFFFFILAPFSSQQELVSALAVQRSPCIFWTFFLILFICSGVPPLGPRWRCCQAPPRWWSSWWQPSCAAGACSWSFWRHVWSSWLSASWRDGCWLLCCLFTTAGVDPGDPVFIISPHPLQVTWHPRTGLTAGQQIFKNFPLICGLK